MAAKKYVYNKKTLQFEPYILSRRQKQIRILKISAILLVISALIRFGYGELYNSPKQAKLEQENIRLTENFNSINQHLFQINKVMSELQFRDDSIYRALLSVSPIPNSIREAGIGGSEKYNNLQGFESSALMTRTNLLTDKLYRQLYIQSKSYDEIIKHSLEKEKELSHMPFLMPMSQDDIYRVSDYFGHRIDPFDGTKHFHHGIDYAGLVGSPVYATGNGKIILVKHSKTGYGNEIVIDHGYGFKTRYAHLNEIIIKEGQKVKRGEQIATLGSSGKSTGPHLHYEVVKGWTPLNPLDFYDHIPAEEFEQIVDLARN